ncbi:alpha/beta fold hydrolase [Amycolatopsis ultiminotia]|uniref:Alpha/beta fold hydrolase n=1 Tax=Amycolatopsis ultiminotia TaxID=543629 RepID=A0ABP6XK22_9PSEU
MTGTPWLRRLGPGPAQDRLVCLPYAGGTGSAYRDWARWLPDGLGLWVADLPAREHRMLEEPVTDLDELIEVLAGELSESPRPTSLFGHSFGALVAFELARRFPVRCLFVSGMAAPQTLVPRPAPADAEILADLRALGVAPELLADPDLLELVLPGIRADYAMAQGYRYRHGAPLTVPVYALGGTADAQVPASQLSGWAEQTTGPCEVRTWAGGHLYLRDHAAGLSRFVAERHLSSTGALS